MRREGLSPKRCAGCGKTPGIGSDLCRGCARGKSKAPKPDEVVLKTCESCGFRDEVSQNQEQCLRCGDHYEKPSNPDRLTFWCGRCDLFGVAPHYEESRCGKCGMLISVARRELPSRAR
mgnify:FL=1